MSQCLILFNHLKTLARLVFSSDTKDFSFSFLNVASAAIPAALPHSRHHALLALIADSVTTYFQTGSHLDSLPQPLLLDPDRQAVLDREEQRQYSFFSQIIFVK